MSDIAAIIVAAGKGERAGSGIPKQYRQLGRLPVLTRTLLPFLTHPDIKRVVVVINDKDREHYEACLSYLPQKSSLLSPVTGGKTRQESVYAGLIALGKKPPSHVLVHDGARPLISANLISAIIAASHKHTAVIPGLTVNDTIKVIDHSGEVIETPDRSQLRAVQTPQVFSFELLFKAHSQALTQSQKVFTDDAALMEWAGHSVYVTAGEETNMKLTTQEDFKIAEQYMLGSPALISKTGTGFDVHAFTEGNHIWLGGIKIAHTQGVTAHSDGDVVLHALTDALLGALADGDIGSHFPPSDPKWKGAASDQFLAHAVQLLKARGGILDHLDATVICETPKVGLHREAMRERIASIANIPISNVSVKATTSERLGFTGRGEGIAAQAAVTIRLPDPAITRAEEF